MRKDKYVLYDGLLPKMRFIDGNERFSKGGDFVISSLWYLRTRKRLSIPSQVKIKIEPDDKMEADDKVQSDDVYARNKSSSPLGLPGIAQTSTGRRPTNKSSSSTSKQERTRPLSKRKRTPKVQFSPSENNEQRKQSDQSLNISKK